MIYWIYGQPGSGKTTIAKLLGEHPELQPHGKWANIDGDHIRELFDNKDYSREGRMRNCDFAINLAKYLISQDINVIVSLVTPYEEMREKVRRELPGVFLVELCYNHEEARRNPDYLVKDYEESLNDGSYSAAGELLNTSTLSIEDTIEFILSL